MMIINTKDLYSFSQVAEILGISTERVFELSSSPYVETVCKCNRTYFTEKSIKQLVLMGGL